MPTTVRSAADAAAPERSRHAVAALAAAVVGFFVITLDATIVNVALPTIRDELGGGMTGLQWLVDGYTLMFAALLLSAGALADRIGARRAFGSGVVVFAAASAACGLAPGLGILVAARFLQGAGAAVVMPTTLALIREAYDDRAGRAHAVAVWATGGAAAAAAGPLVGGVLTELSWRLIFFINVPVGVVALLLLARITPSPRRRVPFDLPGQVAAVAGMGGLTYGVIEAGADGFTASHVIAALAVAVLGTAGFFMIEARTAHPMVPLEMFRNRAMATAVTIGFAFMIGFYGMPFLLSLYFQQVRGLSSMATGVAFLPMMAFAALFTPASSRLVHRIGRRASITGGLLLMAAAMIILAVLPATAPPWAVAALMIPVGLGGPLVMPPLTAHLLDTVPAHRAGVAGGILNTARQIGGALAVAVFGALLAGRAGFLHGLRMSLFITVAVLLSTIVVTPLLGQRHDTT
ncbi:Multidrug resistance protein Stp [Streptomyces sp. RB17]|uniref:MFS transporter n=1 Tax=Streptomyces sp. RB17 TaxID=2585197 RepID=UPI00130D1851|nr:MFS transporter [Streptomyces sp. RB17]MQY34561.1 Multidrug resistance protein Stp [Streptomyces sp. RB17]